MNEVNGRDNVFVRCLSVCVCARARSGRSMGVNANSSKTVKATDFKFDTSLPRDSLDTDFWGAWPGSRDPLNVSVINGNNSKTVKATDFEFGTSVPRDSPDVTPKFFSKRGVARVT